MHQQPPRTALSIFLSLSLTLIHTLPHSLFSFISTVSHSLYLSFFLFLSLSFTLSLILSFLSYPLSLILSHPLSLSLSLSLLGLLWWLGHVAALCRAARLCALCGGPWVWEQSEHFLSEPFHAARPPADILLQMTYCKTPLHICQWLLAGPGSGPRLKIQIRSVWRVHWPQTPPLESILGEEQTDRCNVMPLSLMDRTRCFQVTAASSP
ncbi:hypothetical protein AALO_G00029960 [Alosa alosa]|uniref:Uncharacterized protein n=1 Tax=Alosa alosa TaxID=278164 RepID=A0AAV6HGQ2_9TELE|nr:hypothetical protein AALO_G00029960 [Alosa alosa]